MRSLFGLLSLSEIIEIHTLYAGCVENMHTKITQHLIINSEGIIIYFEMMDVVISLTPT